MYEGSSFEELIKYPIDFVPATVSVKILYFNKQGRFSDQVNNPQGKTAGKKTEGEG